MIFVTRFSLKNSFLHQIKAEKRTNEARDNSVNYATLTTPKSPGHDKLFFSYLD